MTMTRDITRYDAQMLKDAEAWTEIDGDLAAVPDDIAAPILQSRCETSKCDHPRTDYWHDPETVDAIRDIAYLPDGGNDTAAGQVRGHLLDIYLPHEAVVRGGRTTPVYVDVHGGGFCYGYKELNRNFNTHLAARGFAVVSLNYRPAPQTDLKGQLADVQAALRWLKGHLEDYPVDPDSVFITGDSAGGALSLLTLAVENSPKAAAAFGIDRASGIGFKGGALVCGVYSLASAGKATGRGIGHEAAKRTMLEDMLSPSFFAGLEDADPDFLTAADIVANVDLPPLFLLTSSDDFIQAETLGLATALARKGADFELQDWKTGTAETLGHVFPVCMTWLDESQQVLDSIRDFSYVRI